MKRRNAECGKVRRQAKRNKIGEGVFGSNLLSYVKLIMVWLLVLTADFLLEFRFEYLWPFWLLLRSVYDSVKYQGVAFSVFFVGIALTSDFVCYLFIPVQWLFFAASTYVWVQYVWHTDRGICLPTLALWGLFIYIELTLRLNEIRTFPINTDICHPFAAHCIGYPVVTLGFGFKSYVSYRFRLRKQKEVEKENDFHYNLIQQALPLELQRDLEKQKALPSNEDEQISEAIPSLSSSAQAPVANGNIPHNTSVSSSQSSSGSNRQTDNKRTRGGGVADRAHENEGCKGGGAGDASQTTGQSSSGGSSKKHGHNSQHIEDVEVLLEVTSRTTAAEKRGSISDLEEEMDALIENEKNNKYKHQNGHVSTGKGGKIKDTNSTVSNKKAKANSSHNNSINSSLTNSGTQFNNNKDEVINRLEGDVKRLKADLQSSRGCEQELKTQLSTINLHERSQKSELYQLRSDNESLQTKLHNLVTTKQQDRQNISALEKKLAEERKQKATLESQLATERRAKKAEEATAAKALAMANAAKLECSDECKVRWREMEKQRSKAVEEMKFKEDIMHQLKKEVQGLQHFKESHAEADRLRSLLASFQEKTQHLESSLSAENRLKQDLFSALGEHKRQIEILQSLLLQKDQEILDLKGKFAEAVSLIPTSSPLPTNHDSMLHYSPRYSPTGSYGAYTPSPPRTPLGGFLEEHSQGACLNPNANDYLPKSPQ